MTEIFEKDITINGLPFHALVAIKNIGESTGKMYENQVCISNSHGYILINRVFMTNKLCSPVDSIKRYLDGNSALFEELDKIREFRTEFENWKGEF